jgi:hypothetical protein
MNDWSCSLPQPPKILTGSDDEMRGFVKFISEDLEDIFPNIRLCSGTRRTRGQGHSRIQGAREPNCLSTAEVSLEASCDVAMLIEPHQRAA